MTTSRFAVLTLLLLAGCNTTSPSNGPKAVINAVVLYCKTAESGNNSQDVLNACTTVIEAWRSDELKGDALNSRGLIYARTGRSDAALADFDAAAGLMVDPAPAYANRADVYRTRGRYDLMISDLESAKWLDPEDPQTYSARSRVLSVEADYAVALPVAEKALVLGFDESRSYDSLAHALMGLGRAEEAEAAFAEAIEHGDNDWLRAYQLALARKGYDPGRSDGVLDEATKAALSACIRDNCRWLLD